MRAPLFNSGVWLLHVSAFGSGAHVHQRQSVVLGVIMRMLIFHSSSGKVNSGFQKYAVKSGMKTRRALGEALHAAAVTLTDYRC